MGPDAALTVVVGVLGDPAQILEQQQVQQLSYLPAGCAVPEDRLMSRIINGPPPIRDGVDWSTAQGQLSRLEQELVVCDVLSDNNYAVIVCVAV